MIWMCRKCRRDRKRCQPRERDWLNLRQRCLRCIGLNSECGPPEQAKQSDVEDTANPYTSTSSMYEPTSSSQITNSMSLNRTLDIGADHVATEALTLSFVQHRGTSFQTSVTSDSGDGSSNVTRATVTPTSARKSFEDDGRSLLKHSEDCSGTRRCLQQDRLSIWERQQQVGASNASKAACKYLENCTQVLDLEIQQLLREIITIAREDMGPSKEAFLRRLRAFCRKLEGKIPDTPRDDMKNDCTISGIDQIRATIDIAYHQCLRRKEHFSDADFIMDVMTTHSDASAVPDFGSERQTKIMFERASFAIRQILESLDLEDDLAESSLTDETLDSSDMRSSRAYSAAQLAYRVGRKDLARRWWRQNPASLAEQDLLQGNAVHYVTCAGDFQTLRQFGLYYPDILKSTATDILGHSPLAIAAIEGRVDMFQYLITMGAPIWTYDKDNRSISSLAARAGRREIIDYMLETQIFTPPIEEALGQAIQGGHEVLASHIIQTQAEQLRYCDSRALQGVLHQAMLREMRPVVDQILTIQQPSFLVRSPTLAISTLEHLQHHYIAHHYSATSYYEQPEAHNLVSPVTFGHPTASNEEPEDLEGDSDNRFLWTEVDIPFDGNTLG